MELTPVLPMTKAGQPCTLHPAMATITLVSGEGEFWLPASLWQRFRRMLFILIQHVTEIAVFHVFGGRVAS